jgi:hypothetical protein
MGRTESNVGSPGFILGANYDANDGRQIDWANVTGIEGSKAVAGGTIMAETANGLLAPRKAGVQDTVPADYPATCILLASAEQSNNNDALSGYGVVLGGVVFSNLLQDTLEANFDSWLTELKDNGTGFVFETYDDDRTA